MGIDFCAVLIIGFKVPEETLFEATTIRLCTHNADGFKFCPECGLPENKRARVEHRPKPEVRKFLGLEEDASHAHAIGAMQDTYGARLGFYLDRDQGVVYGGRIYRTESHRSGGLPALGIDWTTLTKDFNQAVAMARELNITGLMGIFAIGDIS